MRLKETKRLTRIRAAVTSFAATAAVIALVTAAPASAQAVNWYTYKSSSTATVRTWYSVTTGAQYNRARTTTFYDAQATAFVSVAGIGSSSAGSQVDMSWATYQAVTASCKWDGVMISNGATGLLNCYLGY